MKNFLIKNTHWIPIIGFPFIFISTLLLATGYLNPNVYKDMLPKDYGVILISSVLQGLLYAVLFYYFF